MIKIIGKWVTIGNDPHIGLLKEYQHTGMRIRTCKKVIYIGIVVLKKVGEAQIGLGTEDKIKYNSPS